MGISEAFKQANLGLRTGIGIERLDLEERRFAEGKRISELQAQIANKQADAELIKQTNELKKIGFDFIKFATPAEGWNKNAMDKIVSSAKAQFGVDFSSMFQEQVDEKTGNPVAYTIESEEVFKKRIDDENADEDRKIRAAEAANDKIKTGLMQRGIFDTPEELVSFHLSKDPKTFEGLSPDEAITKVAENLLKFDAPASTREAKFAKGGTELAIEKKLASLNESAFAVERIADTYQEQFLTVPGKLKRFSLNAAAKLAGKKGAEWLQKKVYKDKDEQLLGQAWEFHSELGRNFDAYRHEITGAQAAVKELKILEKRVLNSDMTSPEFEYALKSYSQRVRRQIRLQRLLLAEGYKGQAFWDEFNRQVVLPGDKTISSDNIQTRGDQLKDLYSTEFSGRELSLEINKQLRREGWLK